MKEPIIINNNGSLDIFETVAKAERYIEPIDVKNNEYNCFDSEGRILRAVTIKDSSGIERVVIEDEAETQFNGSELKDMLKAFLINSDYPKDRLENMNLEQLVQESLKYKTD